MTRSRPDPAASDPVAAPPDEPPLDGAIPAATLIVMRPATSATDVADEILMVRRSKAMVFAAGAAVFPGGRIEPDDHRVAADHGLDGDSLWAAARVAAIRETLEETALPVGWPGLDVQDISAVRAALLAGEPLSALLMARDHQLDLDALQPWARWCPNFKETRTFDTCFFVTRAPAHTAGLSVDSAEHSQLFWSSATAALTAADRGDIDIIFPTRRNLERLAQFDRFQDVGAHAATIPPRRITPWIERVDGEARLCIPDGLGYPLCQAPLHAVRRQ